LGTHNIKEVIPFRIGKWAKKLSFLVTPVVMFSVSCSTQTPFDSLADSVYQSSGTSGSSNIHSFVFEAASSGGALTADKNVYINEGNLLTTFVIGTNTAGIVPTILFCGDSSCATGKTADELGIHYKPRYREADDSFYSCPAPIPGRNYDKTTGWFETAVVAGWCTKEDRSKIFKEPTVYTVTGSDGSIRSYRFTANFVDGTASDMTELSFLQSKNPALSADVKKTISTHPSAVSVTLPFGVSKASLVPTFSITGSKVTHTTEGGAEIVSSSTAVDFTNPVDLFVVEADGAGGQAYTVTVTTQNPLNEFKLETSKNPGLSRDYTGTVDHNAKTVSFVFDAGENTSALVPTIDVTDSSITVSPSGDSAQNFGSSLTYRFTASSGSYVDYTVSSSFAAEVIINEVECSGNSNPEDYIELYVKSGGSMAGWKLKEWTSARYTFDPTFQPATGDYIVLHYDSANQGTYTNEDVSGSKSSSSGTDSVSTAWDVYTSSSSFTCTDQIAILENSDATIVDLVPVSNRDNDATSTSMGYYHTIWADSASYKWSFSVEPADGTNDETIQNECALASQSVQRKNVNTDTNLASDFCSNTATMGAVNNCP